MLFMGLQGFRKYFAENWEMKNIISKSSISISYFAQDNAIFIKTNLYEYNYPKSLILFLLLKLKDSNLSSTKMIPINSSIFFNNNYKKFLYRIYVFEDKFR